MLHLARRLALGRSVADAAPAASVLAASTSTARWPRVALRVLPQPIPAPNPAACRRVLTRWSWSQGWASDAGGSAGETNGEGDTEGEGDTSVEMPVQEARSVPKEAPVTAIREPSVELRGLPVPSFVKKPERVSLGLLEAIQEVKAMAKSKGRKWDETVEIAMNLGVDPKRSDQNVRGMAVLPHGVGKTARVAVFARGKDAEEALAAGADVVGAEDLVDQIKAGGALNFDRVIGHPSVMPILSQVARILGPRGLMPNPKLGTMTTDIAGAVKQAKMGQIEFRADKTAIVHAPVGKVSFDDDKLLENVQALIQSMIAAKPKTLKGSAAGTGFIKKAYLSSTMGRSVRIKHDNVLEMQSTRK